MKKLVGALVVLIAAGVVIVTVDSGASGDDQAQSETKRTGGPRSDVVSAGNNGDTTSSTAPPRDVVVSDQPQSPRPPPSSTPVDPSALGSTVGAQGPTGVIDGDIEMVTDHELLEDVTIHGCVVIEADDVTLRNVTIECGYTYPIKDNGSSGTRVENVTIDCLGAPDKGIYFENASDFGVDRIEIRNCDDQFFIDGGLGESWITGSVFHEQAPAVDAHTDGAQIATFETTTGTLLIEGNWWEYDREGCCENAVVFVSGEGALTVDLRFNRIDGDFGTHLVRCHGESTCLVERNIIDGVPVGLVVQHPSPRTGAAVCNRFLDGALVPLDLYSGVTVDNSDC